MTDKPNKLFHVLVVVGASLTGAACGGETSALPVDAGAARDAAADARDAAPDVYYVGIAPPQCGHGGRCDDAGYPTIVPNLDAGHDAYGQITPPPLDAGADGYAHIAPNLDSGHDAYGQIVPPPYDAGDLDVYVGISPAIDAGYPQIG